MNGDQAQPTSIHANLARSEERLRRAQALARLGSWELDLRTRVMWGSGEAFHVYGLEPTADGQLPYALVQEIPLPEYRPVLDKALADLLAGTLPYSLRFRIRRHGDGAVRTVHSFAEVHRDAAGRPLLVTGTVQDVTDQEERDQEMMRALRASEERARLALEKAADAIFLGNPAGDFIGVNQQAEALTGYTRDELLSGNMRMLFKPEVLAGSPLRYDLVIAGETVINERILTRKDGTGVAVEMHTRRISDGTLQAIIRDISERRRLEEQLQLRQRMDSVGALTSGIAHDFNNILVGIMGFADLLRTGAERFSAEQREAVDAILKSCRRASDLVQGLQLASRGPPGQSASFDLGEVAAEVCAVVRETTDRMVVKELRIPRGRFAVRGDPSGVHHALLNLLVNAVQAIELKVPAPGDRVFLDAEEHQAGEADRLGLRPGRWIHVTVGDTGVGMTEEVRRHAFDPLFTTKEKGARKGQGLGLAMVYNVVVRQHGGAVDAVSVPGMGSTFHLYLPAGETLPTAEPRPRPPAAGGRETILVVDDEELIVRLTRRILERAGYRVLTASDGEQALERFGPAGAGIDLVLLDRTLPRLHGDLVLERLRSLRPGVRVIVSTGDASIALAQLPGAAAVLGKPYLPDQLCALVREVLDRQVETTSGVGPSTSPAGEAP